MKTTTRHLLRSALSLAVFGIAPAQAFAAPATFALQDSKAEAPAACACTCPACLAKHGPKADAVLLHARSVELFDARSVEAGSLETVKLTLDPVGTAKLDAEIAALDADLVVLGELVQVAEAAPKQEPGYMGVTLDEDDGEVTLGSVMPKSPAERAALEAGDVIVAVDEMPVRKIADLQGVMKGKSPGDIVTVEIERGDEEMTISFELGKRSVLNLGTGTLARVAIPPPAPLPAVPVERLRALGYASDPEVEEEPIIEDFEISDHNETIEEEVDILLPTDVAEVRSIAPMRVRLRKSDFVEGRPTIRLDTRTEWGAQPRELQEVVEGGLDDEEIRVILEAVEGPVGKEGAGTQRRVIRMNKTQPIRSRPTTKSRTELPHGYIEIETRRELRPAGMESGGELRDRLARLESEIAELTDMIEQLRRELDRRNPR